MAVFIRAKRVSDPLDDKVKARLLSDEHNQTTGYASSGSEHEAAADSSCLFGLVNGFLEIDEPAADDAAESDHVGGSDNDDGDGDRSAQAAETVRDLFNPSGKEDPFRLRLHSDVAEAAEALAMLRWSGSRYRREVMARLREAGYNAGICKARWESCGGLTAGSYEYIDVLAEVRYIVDLEFAAEFEVARATAEYRNLVAALPMVMVGWAEEVRLVVRIAAAAAKRSLKRRDLHVPPWRKSRYMLAKWLGPYRRTVNLLPSSAGAAAAGGGSEIKFCAVGFWAARVESSLQPPGIGRRRR